MRVLVTGGAGFIGSHVVDEYIRLGHTVFVIDDESSGNPKQLHPKAKYFKANICDNKRIRNIFRDKKIDVINHHAAQIDVRKSISNPQFDASVNVIGLLNLLELGKDKKIKKFFLSASGGTAYGECKRPAKEGDPEVPLAPYGISKLAGEKYLHAYSALYGIKYTVFRYGNVYGPRQDPHGEAGVVAIFSNNLLSGKRSFIFGSGKQTRDFVYVGDVAKANGLALTRGHNQIVNIGTGKETSVNKLYREMAKLVNDKRPAIYKRARAGELNRSFLSIKNAKKVLNWLPQASLQKGLSLTISYFDQKRRRLPIR